MALELWVTSEELSIGAWSCLVTWSEVVMDTLGRVSLSRSYVCEVPDETRWVRFVLDDAEGNRLSSKPRPPIESEETGNKLAQYSLDLRLSPEADVLRIVHSAQLPRRSVSTPVDERVVAIEARMRVDLAHDLVILDQLRNGVSPVPLARGVNPPSLRACNAAEDVIRAYRVHIPASAKLEAAAVAVDPLAEPFPTPRVRVSLDGELSLVLFDHPRRGFAAVVVEPDGSYALSGRVVLGRSLSLSEHEPIGSMGPGFFDPAALYGLFGRKASGEA